MGLGDGPGEWEDFEWVSLADLPVEPLAEALLVWLADHPVWTEPGLERVLLVDLDNLRADPARWRVRMAAMLALARQGDHAHFAGQRGAVRRARPYLDDLAETLQEVPDGSDLADHALLAAASELDVAGMQVTVVSNDGIFAGLAERGPLTVVSPGRDALSNALRRAAARVVDLSSLEAAAVAAAEGA